MKRAFEILRSSWGTVVIVLDGGTTALANVLSLTFASRNLTEQAFAQFALLQLVVITIAMIQRAFVLAPGLASQRNHGRGTFPPSLVLRISLPAAVLLSAGFVVSSWTNPLNASLSSAVFVASWGALSMDVIRYCLLTLGKRRAMLTVNVIWSAVLIFGLVSSPPSVVTFLFIWGTSGLVISLTSVISIHRAGANAPRLRLRDVWKLGKWSGIDASMSACANLLPMFAASALTSGELVGTYRLLQVTMGPLNIISASLITIYSVDSWKFANPSEIESLNNKVRRYSRLMLLASLIYMSCAETVVIASSGRWGVDTLRIGIIVLVTAGLGALTASYSAGALALGAQKSGALLRVLIVAWSIGITVVSSTGIYLPWSDPIAPVTLFAALAGLIGWSIAYRRALDAARSHVVPDPV